MVGERVNDGGGGLTMVGERVNDIGHFQYSGTSLTRS